MGEATPAHPNTGGFVPMLGGVGMGSMPGGVNGGPMIAASRGSSVPQLHSAIVERLRARIELCRRHHATCESRYQRGEAERSDRGHESTLHLLNIVHQQGTGTRKAKGGRGSNQQPSTEYSRTNGEQKNQNSEGDNKLSTRIALQGSLRRKLEGHAPGPIPKQNGLSCGLSGADFKRARLDRGGLGPPHGPCGHSFAQPQSLQGHPSSSSSSVSSMDNALHRKSFMLPPGVDADTFNLTLKEMKQEPSEVASCGQSTADMIFDFKEEGGGQIDPELQDLFDELTKTVPSLNDLEFEKMLKQDDAFGLDLERPGSTGGGGPPASSPSWGTSQSRRSSPRRTTATRTPARLSSGRRRRGPPSA